MSYQENQISDQIDGGLLKQKEGFEYKLNYKKSKMTKIKMSKHDLLDKFQVYQSEATYTEGNKSTHQMIAMQDVEKVIDEIIEKLGNGKKFISSN